MFYLLSDNIFEPVFITSAVVTTTRIFFFASQGYLGSFVQKFCQNFFNPIYLQLNLSIIGMFLLFIYLWQVGADILYCIDGETEKKKLLETAKDINPSVTGNTVNLQTQSVNVNVATDVLNNIGLGGTILDGMKTGTGLTKGGSPWAKTGFALGGGIAGGAMHTIYSSMNKLNYNDNKNTVYQSSDKGDNSSYPAPSVLEGGDSPDLFTAEDLRNILNSNIILRAVIIYLINTFRLFFISVLVANSKLSFNWIKNLPYGNSIYPKFIKLFNYLGKSSITFFFANWMVLVFSYIFIVYFLHWFIKRFYVISEIYIKSYKPDLLLNTYNTGKDTSLSNLFTEETLIEYLKSDLMLHKVIVFLLLILIDSFVSMLVTNNKLSFNWIKNFPYGNSIYPKFIKLFNYWDKINLMFFLVWIVILIACIASAYYLYYFVNDFYVLCYLYVNSLN